MKKVCFYSQFIYYVANKLAEAAWINRNAIPSEDSTYSLTWSMIEAFGMGKYKISSFKHNNLVLTLSDIPTTFIYV